MFSSGVEGKFLKGVWSLQWKLACRQPLTSSSHSNPTPHYCTHILLKKAGKLVQKIKKSGWINEVVSAIWTQMADVSTWFEAKNMWFRIEKTPKKELWRSKDLMDFSALFDPHRTSDHLCPQPFWTLQNDDLMNNYWFCHFVITSLLWRVLIYCVYY